MSGGHFDYQQHRISNIAEEVAELVGNYEDEKDVQREFIMGQYLLELAYVYAQRIDWLVCADDGPEAFRLRLREQVGMVHNMMEQQYGLRLRVELEEAK